MPLVTTREPIEPSTPSLKTLTLPPLQFHGGDVFFSDEFLREPLVQAELSRLQSDSGRAWLSEGLEKAEPYRDFIIGYLEARSMPRDILWLALIESSFDPTSVSRSGASGMWQFMKNSIGDSMVINDWVDERFDFWKSTNAAIAKLKENFESTHDWLLSLAAYNAGLGFMTRQMKKYPGEDFWALARRGIFPQETLLYVPRFLAVAYLCNHPVRNGLSYSWPTMQDWVRIQVDRPLDIAKLENASGLPKGSISNANAELKHGITPPLDGPYFLKVPVAWRDAITDTIQNGDATVFGKNMSMKVHELKSGDTLYAIAHSYGTTVTAILKTNPGLNPRALHPGTSILLPIFNKEGTTK